MKKKAANMDKLMATGARRADFGPKAETKLYLKQAWQMGKNLITTSMQPTDSGGMTVSQRTTVPRVVAK